MLSILRVARSVRLSARRLADQRWPATDSALWARTGLLAALAALIVAFAGAVGGGSPAAAVVAPPSIVLPIDPTRLDDVRWTDTWGAPRSGGRSHIGVDMMGQKMIPLLAVADSVVDWGRFNNQRGTILRLRADNGWEYQYIHLNNDTPGTDDGSASCRQALAEKLCATLESDGDLKKGVRFAAGEVVGYLGDSGNAEWTGAHLHFEAYKPDGQGVVPVNPTPLVDAARARLTDPGDPVGPWANPIEAATSIFDRLEGRPPQSHELTRVQQAAVEGGLARVLTDALAGDSTSESVDRLYLAFFQRQPDETGLRHWTAERARGQSLEAIAESFAQSTEYQTRYAHLDFSAFLDVLYRDVLKRPPDDGGKAYWLAQLEAGRVGRGTIVVWFSESAELKAKAQPRTELNLLHRAMGLQRPTPAEQSAWNEARRSSDLAVAVAGWVSGRGF